MKPTLGGLLADLDEQVLAHGLQLRALLFAHELAHVCLVVLLRVAIRDLYAPNTR